MTRTGALNTDAVSANHATTTKLRTLLRIFFKKTLPCLEGIGGERLFGETGQAKPVTPVYLSRSGLMESDASCYPRLAAEAANFPMKYMVIETFAPGKRGLVYERFHDKGRMLPDGLDYLNSWVEAGGDRCFQLMETARPELFREWTAAWEDLVAFEIVPLEGA